MYLTRIFQSGNSLAVRIPKEFHLKGPDVEILKRNGELIIREVPKNLSKAFELLQALGEALPENFERNDLPPQSREEF
jgi:antitoxin VapB